jgi:hypothetical protein
MVRRSQTRRYISVISHAFSSFLECGGSERLCGDLPPVTLSARFGQLTTDKCQLPVFRGSGPEKYPYQSSHF